ncbi:MAG: HAD-IC family P-type ATPase [Clostridiales bacterium]|nr:HAD-IC family P-type ATPase [Clostridiales bacterium]
MKRNKIDLARCKPDINIGLTELDVKLRRKAGFVNRQKKVVGKSYLQIFMSNIFTFFNLLGFIIFLLMLLAGSVTNMMFVVIIVANTVIGIFQEIRSKLAVEKLSIVSEPTAEVIREGEQRTIATRDIAIDEIILYSSGNQISCDSQILTGEVEVNESMLTGESDAVKKRRGDTLYSGSFVVSGNCTASVINVGKDNYVEQLSARVKRAKTPNSELMRGIRSIIKFISIIIFPLGILTFFLSNQMQGLIGSGANIWTGYFGNGTATVDGQLVSVVEWVNESIIAMSGSMIGMVPSGMVLLTSVALAVAALKLAKKNVLVRELPCIEMLARIDTLCLDKTGTITDGSMTVEQIIPLDGHNEEEIKTLLSSLIAATGDDNMTAQALKKYLEGVATYDFTQVIPFSSARKYSAATLVGKGTVAMGASEFMFKKSTKEFNAQTTALLKQGLRVLAVGHAKQAIKNDEATGLEPIAIVVLQDTVRDDAPEIIKWFKDNDVAVKVISGDNPVSVSVIAQKVGVKDADKYISLDGMSEEEVCDAANKYTVFGRVTPEQKAILVRAMKQAGKTVAMTGDGVNDILAMRESDCAISVGCGTDAAKTVANLVLMDNKFSSMPSVVAEGRQVVNNIQNSSSLFLMKTSMTVFTTILCLILAQTYPFGPKQLYAIEFFVIGISSFLLALKPNRALIKGKFLVNTLRRTLPSGIAMFLSVAMTYAFANVLGLDADQISTVAMFSMTATGVISLWILLFPYGWYNLVVGAVGTVGTALCYLFFPWALGIIAGWFGKTEAPMFVSISGYSILFIALNALVMGGIVIGLKFLVKYIDKTRRVRAEINDFVNGIGDNEIYVEENEQQEKIEE